jgi:hypothetical protein
VELLLKYPFEKGDLGGFEKLQTEGIYGKRYNYIIGACTKQSFAKRSGSQAGA